jgi:hypothetical protein
MDDKVIRKFKWFWGWQDQGEEEWLRQMSQRGYHLKEPGTFGVYHFVQGEPCDYVYRLDFIDSPQKDRQEYLQLFQDVGWDYLGEAMSWQYFRTLAKPGESPEIFTDTESKIQKYKRMLALLTALAPSLALMFIILMDELPAWPVVVFTLLLALDVWFAIQILRRINQLKRI